MTKKKSKDYYELKVNTIGLKEFRKLKERDIKNVSFVGFGSDKSARSFLFGEKITHYLLFDKNASKRKGQLKEEDFIWINIPKDEQITLDELSNEFKSCQMEGEQAKQIKKMKEHLLKCNKHISKILKKLDKKNLTFEDFDYDIGLLAEECKNEFDNFGNSLGIYFYLNKLNEKSK